MIPTTVLCLGRAATRDNLPYRDPSGFLVVPCGHDFKDMKFFHAKGYGRARDMAECVAHALDVLGAEVASGLRQVLNIRVLLRIAGRPGRFTTLDAAHAGLARRRERIRIGRRAEIADALGRAVPCG